MHLHLHQNTFASEKRRLNEYFSMNFRSLIKLTQAVGRMVSDTASAAVWGSIIGLVKADTVVVTAAMFLRSCVVQALSRGDRPRHSLHASA